MFLRLQELAFLPGGWELGKLVLGNRNRDHIGDAGAVGSLKRWLHGIHPVAIGFSRLHVAINRRGDVPSALTDGIREIFGRGTLLNGIDLVFGEVAKSLVIHVIPNYHGFLLAILPPGAFITLGLLIATRNWLNLRAEEKAKSYSSAAIPAV